MEKLSICRKHFSQIISNRILNKLNRQEMLGKYVIDMGSDQKFVIYKFFDLFQILK
jgi:hypothetical protein